MKATSRVGILVKIHNLADDEISEGILRFSQPHKVLAMIELGLELF